jgi:hypothetical protein
MQQTFVPELRDVVTTPCSSRNTNRFRSPFRKRFFLRKTDDIKKLANILDLQYNQG